MSVHMYACMEKNKFLESIKINIFLLGNFILWTLRMFYLVLFVIIKEIFFCEAWNLILKISSGNYEMKFELVTFCPWVELSVLPSVLEQNELRYIDSTISHSMGFLSGNTGHQF